jgi:hypothetical protein
MLKMVYEKKYQNNKTDIKKKLKIKLKKNKWKIN